MALHGGLTRASVARLRRAAGQVSWTVVDQALLGFSNFAANLLLARWLSAADYGGYVAASAVFWMVASVHTGLLVEPMMVFGAGRFADRLSPYFGVLAVFHWVVAGVVAVGLAGTGLVLMLGTSTLSGLSLLGYALATPVILLLWLFRRSFYVRSMPRLAAGASVIYLAGILSIMYLLYRAAALSSFTAPLAAAAASGLTIGCMIARQRFRLWSPWRGGVMAEAAGAHWRYGRWAVGTSVLTAVPGSLYFLVVPSLVGLEANGALNALMILIMPAAQAYSAFTFLLIPAFSRRRRETSANAEFWQVLGLLVLAASIYAILVGRFGGFLMELLYHGRYTQYAHFAWLIGLLGLPMAVIALLGSALRAQQRPDRVLWAYAVSGVVTCTVGIAAVAVWGLFGAILGLLLTYVTTMLVMVLCISRTGTNSRPQTICE